LGLALITISVYLLFLKIDKSQSFLKNLFGPFALIFNSKPVLCAFLSVLPPALSVVFLKKSVMTMDALSFSLFFTFLIGSMALFIELFNNKEKLILDLKQFPKPFFFYSGFLLMLTQFTFALASKYIMVANLMVLNRISIVFQIVLAYFILKEKDEIKKRLIISLFVVLGFYIISISQY
jgi:uncharacterized membrane protein